MWFSALIFDYFQRWHWDLFFSIKQWKENEKWKIKISIRYWIVLSLYHSHSVKQHSQKSNFCDTSSRVIFIAFTLRSMSLAQLFRPNPLSLAPSPPFSSSLILLLHHLLVILHYGFQICLLMRISTVYIQTKLNI